MLRAISCPGHSKHGGKLPLGWMSTALGRFWRCAFRKL